MATRILFVENDQGVAVGLSWLLRDGGFEVDALREGRPAIGLIAHRHPDVALLDLSLPDIDGVVLAEAVRRLWPRLPIIFITGHGPDHPGLRSILADSSTVLLQKPFAIEDLFGALAAMKH